MASSSDLLRIDVCDNWRRIKGNHWIEQTSDSTIILLHIETETGKEEVYNYPSESTNYYHLRKLLSSEVYIPSDIVCGNEKFII